MKFWCKFKSRCHLVSIQFYSDCAPDLTWIKLLISGLRLKGTYFVKSLRFWLAMNYEVKKQMVDGQRNQSRSTEKACPEEISLCNEEPTTKPMVVDDKKAPDKETDIKNNKEEIPEEKGPKRRRNECRGRRKQQQDKNISRVTGCCHCV
ncbi:hypothetical protein HanRHA438_Chr16g0771561 [Helianthus annuus]|nr:hypothetical protein HanRHA438_Chr16g0771561 [Helianthus annuus]